MVTDSNQVNEQTIERTRKRVRKMSDRELTSWAQVAIPGMQRHLDYYERTGDPAHLGEMSFAEMQLNIVITEMMVRQAAREEEGLDDQAPV